MNVVFDLDGTLADGSHREHLLTRCFPKRWDEYFSLCGADAPIEPMLSLLRWISVYPERNNVEIWTGRSGRYRDETRQWLVNQGISLCASSERQAGISRLLMRDHDEYIEDWQLKERWLKQASLLDRRPDLVFEDRTRCVEMWRRHGIQCCQVRPGDF